MDDAKKRSLFGDEDGFSTVGMAVALLVAVSLVFSSAQVYRVSSAAAAVQEVADAAALAAQNEVAEFMVLVRVCDAVTLSLSLTGITLYGSGIAALCAPSGAAVSAKLMELGGKAFDARDAFAEKAVKALNMLQKALPFLMAVNVASVAAANNAGTPSANYLAFALPVPAQGKEAVAPDADASRALRDKAESGADDVATAAARAEEHARAAQEAKMRAFLRDCGDAPEYCMQERAQQLAGLAASDNPLFASVDAWSFAVPLERARAYYASRLAAEQPADASVEEQARSALRRVYFEYAVQQFALGYAVEAEGSFRAHFPVLPKDVDELRASSLYEAERFPVSAGEEGALTMHAWAGCPAASSVVFQGSVALMEREGYRICSSCRFSAESLGRVASASSVIDNGFEFHYRAVALAAQEYEQALAQAVPHGEAARSLVGELFDSAEACLREAGGARIALEPPGSGGVIVLVADMGSLPASAGFDNLFVRNAGTLGARAAVSAATLLEDDSEDGVSVVSSLLDGVAQEGGAAVGATRIALDCWSGLLQAYAAGQEAVDAALENALDGIPLASASDLGQWAARAFEDCMKTLGLQPADLGTLRPALVNSSHVARAEGAGELSARFETVKSNALLLSGPSTDVFASLISSAEEWTLDGIGESAGQVEVVVAELAFGEATVPLSITFALPPAAVELTEGFVSSVADALRALRASTTDMRVWE